MSSTETENDEPIRTRKRQRHKDKWKGEIAKRARNKGEEYKTRHGDVLVPARTIGSLCKCGCMNSIGRDKVKEIFDKFWEIGNYDHQNAYLSKLVWSTNINHSHIIDRPGRKKRNIHYTVIHTNRVITVCRTAFYSIHGITEHRVRTVLNNQGTTGVVSLDGRGKHVNSRVTEICQERRHSVFDHIKSFPMVSSHYCRAKSPHKKYLPPDLNVNVMYNLYIEWLRTNNSDIQPVSKHFYRDIFNNKLNLGIEPPHSDTCDSCDLFNNKIKSLNPVTDNNEIERLKNLKNAHIAVASQVHKILKDCKLIQDPTVGAISIDLQKTLPTPKISTSCQYYKCKLWTYNFDVHNIKTGKAVCYLWNETQAKRGSIEISNCLQHYLLNYVDTNVKYLKIFSDNCGGQNKNINVALTCLKQIHTDRFSKIEHFFMEPGHSYLPCDRDFGHIEKKTKSG